jgi:hypothetical protein
MPRFITFSLPLFALAAATSAVCFAQMTLQQKCGDVIDIMRYSLQGVRGENVVYSLKRNGQTYYELFVSKVDQSKNVESKGLFAPWRLIERQDQSLNYCVIAAGEWIESLLSVHMANPRQKYGMPGSGYQRCSDGKDIQDAIDVRLWANKELGESFTLHLPSDIGDKNFTFLLSNDRYWVLLDEERNNAAMRCFYSRGDAMAAHPNMKMPPVK